jgi:hypothetical protein
MYFCGIKTKQNKSMKKGLPLLVGSFVLTSLGLSAQSFGGPPVIIDSLTYTGAMQTYTVPCGVTSVTISCYGAQGGSGATGGNGAQGGQGGLGGFSTGALAVTPGQSLFVFVGGAGQTAIGGFNGGGSAGSQNAGGGGGASDVRVNSSNAVDRVIVGGGGGGGGRAGCEQVVVSGGTGGAGNGGNGVNGTDAPTSNGVAGGGFGGQSNGNAGAAGIGCGGFLGQPGTAGNVAGVGGNGGNGQACCCFNAASIPGGGGGGGGFQGAGGGGGGSAGTTGCSGNDKGAGGGGGGGSAYIGGVTNGSTTQGGRTGNGVVHIMYTDPTVGTLSPIVGNTTVCAGSSITYTVPTTLNAVSYTWSVPGTMTIVSGQGTNTAIIDVGSASGTISVVANGPCNNSAAVTASIVVNSLPIVVLTIPQTVFCLSDSAYTLSGGLPVGGVYSGTAVTNGVFDPTTAGVGFHSIVYQYTDSNGCSAGTQTQVQVVANPVVSLQAPQTVFCDQASAIILTGGNPAGGTYSGPGVNNGLFDPTAAGVGTHTITYMYTDSIGCPGSATQDFVVNALPVVSVQIPQVTFCSADAAYTLSGGSPAGGTFSGPGVTNGIFSPATAGIGTHVITYTYNDANGCTNTSTQNVTVDACQGVAENLGVATISMLPNPTSDVLNVTWSAGVEVSMIEVMDIQGRIVMTQAVSGGNTSTVKVAELPAGMYSIRLTEANTGVTKINSFVKN